MGVEVLALSLRLFPQSGQNKQVIMQLKGAASKVCLVRALLSHGHLRKKDLAFP